jgi:RNA polymerase primary sigma factor
MLLRTATKTSKRESLKDWMCPLPYIMNDELLQPDAEERLFKNWPGPATGKGRLEPDEETLLFKQLHYCGYRLSKLYKAADKRGPTIAIRQSYSLWAQRYNQIRSRLVEGNLGLVYDLIGYSRFKNLDPDERNSEGMMALLRATDTFDPWRGFRFSTYACNAILRAFARASLHECRRRNKIVASYDDSFEKSDALQFRHADQQALSVERLRRVLRMNCPALTDGEKLVLSHRFPMEEDSRRQTLEHIGRQIRVSKERVRQMQLSALGKLRSSLARDYALQ